jgi:TRAP-type mannitol/chloroaromatic compound transport system substrate-binding protein
VSELINRSEIGPWVNDGTAYYYQGLTEDGRFYISLVWPVRTDSLPDTIADVSEETMNAATNPDTYEQYLIDTQNMLNLLTSSTWEPNLADLDAIIASLRLYE